MTQKQKSYARRYLIYILGLYVVGMGVAMIIVSGIGTSPISSWAYVMSRNTPWSVGTFTFLLNVGLIGGQCWLLRGAELRREWVNIALQIPFSFLFGAFIDINLWLLSLMLPSGLGGVAYPLVLGWLLLGIGVQSVGLVLEVRPQVTMMSAEAFVFYGSRRWKREFGSVKVWFDCSLVALAVASSVLFALTRGDNIVSAILLAVREGTVLAAILTGLCVRWIQRKTATW